MQLFVLRLLNVFFHLIMNKCMKKSRDVSSVINLRTLFLIMCSLHRLSDALKCVKGNVQIFFPWLPKFCWEMFHLKKKHTHTNYTVSNLWTAESSHFIHLKPFKLYKSHKNWGTATRASDLLLFFFLRVCAGICDQKVPLKLLSDYYNQSVSSSTLFLLIIVSY